MQRLADRTTVTIGRDLLCSLRDIATELSRAERRTVTLGEVIGRLVAAHSAAKEIPR